jgi:hypothetical protein
MTLLLILGAALAVLFDSGRVLLALLIIALLVR